jgi:cyclic beta-1,2-glucan synthetase
MAGRHQALVFERKPRLASDKGVLATHFIAEAEPAAGRASGCRSTGSAGSAATAAPAIRWPRSTSRRSTPEGGESAPLDTGLDPVAAFSTRLQIAPGGQARVTFCTAAADNRSTLRAVIDKYRQPSHVERASMMSATLAGIRLRDMRIGAETFAAIQTLTTSLAMTLTRPHALRAEANEVCDRRLLWRFGISGDRPIVLVSAGVAQGFGLLRSLAQGLRLWSWGGVACDLVVVNYEPASYLMALARQIGALRDAHVAACNAQPCAAETGFFILAASDLHGDELSTLRALARVRLNADGRRSPITCRSWSRSTTAPSRTGRRSRPRRCRPTWGPRSCRARCRANSRRPAASSASTSRPGPADPSLDQRARQSELRRADQRSRRRLQLGPEQPPQHADAVVERPGRRPAGRMVPAPGHADHAGLERRPFGRRRQARRVPVSHGQGHTTIGHRSGSLDVSASWCVDSDAAVKQVRLRLINRGHRTINLRVVGIAEWILGANRPTAAPR